MIELENKRRYLRQWELDQRVQIDNFRPGTRVEFSHLNDCKDSAMIVYAYEDDGHVVADIPNILLQKYGYLRVQVAPSASDADHAPAQKNIRIVRAEKPEDYVYTETPTLSYDALDKRVSEIEKKGTVLYTEQSLTNEQRAQARRNIGADGLDWHETEPGYAYTTYIANVGINNGITDWDKVLSIKGGASGDQAVLANVARSVSSLLDGSSKSINKANFVNLFLSNIGVLVDSGCITLPWGFAFAVNETARKVGKISYCAVASQSNGRWVLRNLENDSKYFVIKADGTYADNTLIYPDDTLTKSNRAADAKAVGDALALKADKFDPIEVLIVKSSTANSTKKFKITVNDSGTITATEVT